MVTEDHRIHAQQDGRVLRIELRRPEASNALTPAMLESLADRVEEAQGASVLVLLGTGASFCAGMDRGVLEQSLREKDVDSGGASLARALDALEGFAGATVACVNGPSIGGGVLLALACDLRLAHERAFFQIPVARLGLIYPHRGLAHLLACVGSGRALEMLHTGRRVDAKEALQWGLVNAVEPQERWSEACHAMAGSCGAGAPLALAGHHRLLRDLVHHEHDVERVRTLTREALESRDALEGAQALAQKRLPDFHGV